MASLFATTGALRAWTVGSLVGNMALIVTGGIVRLTKSGLGCPTWPRCTPESYVPQPEAGIHGLIEFGNRTLTFVLIALAIGTFVAALTARTADGRPRRTLRTLALLAALGIPLQGVIGGITVLTQLNPWIVALHLLLSVVLIALCVAMVHDAYGTTGQVIDPAARNLVRVIFGLTAISIALGTVVTGAGPHSGDGGAQRSGLDLEWAAKVHAWSVWLLLAVTIVTLAILKRRMLAVLLALQAAQGVVGYAQFFTGLPLGLVIVHLTGIALLAAYTTHVMLTLRRVVPADTSR